MLHDEIIFIKMPTFCQMIGKIGSPLNFLAVIFSAHHIKLIFFVAVKKKRYKCSNWFHQIVIR